MKEIRADGIQLSEVVHIIERHEAPILGIMTPMHRNRMDSDLISKVKTKEVDFLKGSQKSKFNVIHGGVLPALNKEKSVRSAKEPNILSGCIGKA